MTVRWRVAIAAGGAFLAVAAVTIAVTALHGGSRTAQPGASTPVFVGPAVVRLTSPPRIVYVHPGTKPK